MLGEALSTQRAARRCYPFGQSSCIGWGRKALGRPLRYRIQAMRLAKYGKR